MVWEISADPDLEDKIKKPPIKIPAIKTETAAIKLKFLDKGKKVKTEK